MYDKEKHYKELTILKTIAETLNQNTNMQEMLQTTLEKLLDLTSLKTGWIFLIDDEPDYEHVADHNLPQALAQEDKEVMRCGVCLCLGLYWAGGLNSAVNMIECERLHNAKKYSWGDTGNLTHHATIPLTVRGERLGLLNVGSPGKESFNEEELTFLESVAYQIGTAIERTRLIEQKEKQAVDKIAQYIVNYYANANHVTRYIWKINDMNKLLLAVVREVAQSFHWPTVAIVLKEGNQKFVKSIYSNGKSELSHIPIPHHHDMIHRVFFEHTYCISDEQNEHLPQLPSNQFTVAIPLKVHEIHMNVEPIGALYLGRETETFRGLEMEILEVLTDHISLAMEKIRLYNEWQGWLIAEERNRLARDLHDSVNQKLFSLSLMAGGLKELMKESSPEIADVSHDIGQLAQESLNEMRSLILQMRSQGEVKGILGALQDYAEQIGIYLTIYMKKTVPLPVEIEKAFWRIGQEALNNVKKHAETNRAWIRIEKDSNEIRMKISDQGRGFVPERLEKCTQSIGISSMRERAAEINGLLTISSEEGSGTIIIVSVPISSQKGRGEYEN
ncbi:GAF domain-containing protein [Halalkalibacter sp. APA_J-10(15)]|uniref:sensor histidine kinase n=1 Tax=Halalkalibacter sp. APA_J-10(15) TaxID=2933805 RepID=UPI001FF3B960|nr:GAF domain-containing protein [Halalkalibacter sp. APA_J-10(15)]MCK0471688.1 GAF domain-containing protein [Halalkalibacter sp. APA_J-10(15)]